MSKTVLDAFNVAMGLTDNLTDNSDYLSRAVYVVNSLLPELYLYSDTKTSVSGTKPVPTFVTATSSTLPVDDALAIGVLPHGMIAMLFSDENPVTANFHQQLYQEKLRMLGRVPVEAEDITDLYGGIEYFA